MLFLRVWYAPKERLGGLVDFQLVVYLAFGVFAGAVIIFALRTIVLWYFGISEIQKTLSSIDSGIKEINNRSKKEGLL